MSLPSFGELADAQQPAMDLLALSVAAEFREVDTDASLGMLDVLGEDLSQAVAGTPECPLEVSLACGHVLGGDHGFVGDRERYHHPDNSMLDIVLSRRPGLPILLSVVYIEVARPAGIPLAGVGLPGHFVVGHFGSSPAVLLEPFNAGARIDAPVPESALRPWHPHEIATRMLNNLVSAYRRHGNLGRALRAAQMRLMLVEDHPLRATRKQRADQRSLTTRASGSSAMPSRKHKCGRTRGPTNGAERSRPLPWSGSEPRGVYWPTSSSGAGSGTAWRGGP